MNMVIMITTRYFFILELVDDDNKVIIIENVDDVRVDKLLLGRSLYHLNKVQQQLCHFYSHFARNANTHNKVLN